MGKGCTGAGDAHKSTEIMDIWQYSLAKIAQSGQYGNYRVMGSGWIKK